MFKKNPTSVRLTLRALGYLLSYPDAQLRGVMPQLIDAIQLEQALSHERVAELTAVCQHLAALDNVRDLQNRLSGIARTASKGRPAAKAVVPLEGEGAKRLRGCFIPWP